MSEWYDSQKKPNGDALKQLRERLKKSAPKRETLGSEEQVRLGKLEGIAALSLPL